MLFEQKGAISIGEHLNAGWMIIAVATLTSATKTAIKMIPPAIPKIPEMKEVINVVAKIKAAAKRLMGALVS